MASFLRRRDELVNQSEANSKNHNNLGNHTHREDNGEDHHEQGSNGQHDGILDEGLPISEQPIQSSSFPLPSAWTDKLKEYSNKLRHGVLGRKSNQQLPGQSKSNPDTLAPKPPPEEPKSSLIEAARLSNILLEHETMPALSPCDVKGLDALGLDRKLATTIAFKIELDEDRECSQNDQYSYLIHDLLDALAVRHKITRCKRFAGTWIGCVGFFHAWDNPRQDSYHALAFASEAMFLASNLQLHLCCAVESGKVDGGILHDSPFFDMFGSEIRWILKMVETKKTGIVLVGNFARNLNSRPCREESGDDFPSSHIYLSSIISTLLTFIYPNSLKSYSFQLNTPHSYSTLSILCVCFVVSDVFVQFSKIVSGSVWGVKTDREKIYVLGDMSALVPPVQAALLVRTYLLNEPRTLLGVSSTLNVDIIRDINERGKYGYGLGHGLGAAYAGATQPPSSSSSSRFVSKSSPSSSLPSCLRASTPTMTWQALQSLMESPSPLDCR